MRYIVLRSFFLLFSILSLQAQDAENIDKTKMLYKELRAIKPPNPDIKRINELVDSIQFYYAPVKVKDMDFYTEVYEYINNFPPHIVSWEKTLEVQKEYLHHYKIQLPDDALNSLDAYGNMAFTLTMLSRFKESIDTALLPNLELLKMYHKQDTLSAEDKEFVELGLLVTTSYLVINYRSLGDSREEIRFARENERYLSEIEVAPQYDFIKRDCYVKLMDTYVVRGEYTRYKELLELWKRTIRLKDPITQMIYLNVLTDYQAAVQNSAALEESYNKAKVLFEKTPKPTPESFTKHFRDITSVYLNHNVTSNTIPVEKEIALRKQNAAYIEGMRSYTFSNPAQDFLAIANAFSKQKVYDSVLPYINKASRSIAALPELKEHIPIETARAEHYARLGEISSAKRTIDTVLQKMRYPAVKKLLKMKINGVSGIQSSFAIESIRKLAITYKVIYNYTKAQEDLEASNTLFLLASKVLNAIKISTSLNAREVKYLLEINDGILETYDKIDNKRASSEILNYLELNQANALNNSYFLNTLSKQDTIFRELYKKRKELNYIILTQQNKFQTRPENMIATKDDIYISKSLYENKLKLQKVEENIDAVTSVSKVFASNDIDFQKISEKLADNEVVMRYFYSDSNLYVFKITKYQHDFFKIGARHAINTLLENNYENLRSGKEILDSSLSELLLPSLGLSYNDVNKVIVIGHLELNNLPFESLQIEGSFLINRCIVSYYPSLRLFEYDAVPNNNDKLLAGFAPTYNTSVSSEIRSIDSVDFNFGNLIGAKEEVNKVVSMFSGDSFFGAEATKRNFIEKSKRYDVLHVAGHSYVNSKNASNSMLVFTEDNISSTLTLDEIYGLDLATNLVVLSACDTGNGSINNSEGVMSLARAFHYAGSNATLTSLWKVPDKETSFMMISFYEYLSQGLPKDEALQKAKISYLNAAQEPELKHPFYWAGFVLSGDITPIEPNYFNWYIAAGILLFLLLLGWFFKQKKLKNIL